MKIMSAELTNAEVKYLLELKKFRKSDDDYELPNFGGKLKIPLLSADRKEEFFLYVSSGHIDINRRSFVNVAKKTIPLARIDLAGADHHNPDGTDVSLPHIHIYKERYADKWAYPLPDDFADCVSTYDFLDKFMDYCHIIKRPKIIMELF